MKLEPLILEFDGVLKDYESFVGLQTIHRPTGNGEGKIGYVATIKDFRSRDIRYGNLKATKYTEGKINNQVF